VGLNLSDPHIFARVLSANTTSNLTPPIATASLTQTSRPSYAPRANTTTTTVTTTIATRTRQRRNRNRQTTNRRGRQQVPIPDPVLFVQDEINRPHPNEQFRHLLGGRKSHEATRVYSKKTLKTCPYYDVNKA
jgi:hypothetical protein